MLDAGNGDGGGGGGWNGPSHAILSGHKVVPVDDLTAWWLWFETSDRRVAVTMLGRVRVSTIFLGMDHGWGDCPLWFETFVFDAGLESGVAGRYTTWEEAEAGHARAVAYERAAFNAWIDGINGLERVRVLGYVNNMVAVDNGMLFHPALVYRNRRRTSFMTQTYARRFGGLNEYP
jgi:hypothetical protein